MKEIVTTNYFWGQDVEMSQFEACDVSARNVDIVKGFADTITDISENVSNLRSE